MAYELCLLLIRDIPNVHGADLSLSVGNGLNANGHWCIPHTASLLMNCEYFI